MSELVELEDLLRSLDHAPDVSSIRAEVSAFLSVQNIKAYIYHHLPSIGATDYDEPLFYQEVLNPPRGLVSLTESSNFEALLRENVRSLTTPQFWGDWVALKGKHKSKGVSIPVLGPRGRSGCFSFESPDLNSRDQEIDIPMIQWVCQYAHQNLCRLLTNQRLDLPKLTPREQEILTWIALGKSNAEIADILGISHNTVGTYTRRIFVKTNTNNRTSAALFGITNGLINV